MHDLWICKCGCGSVWLSICQLPICSAGWGASPEDPWGPACRGDSVEGVWVCTADLCGAVWDKCVHPQVRVSPGVNLSMCSPAFATVHSHLQDRRGRCKASMYSCADCVLPSSRGHRSESRQCERCFLELCSMVAAPVGERLSRSECAGGRVCAQGKGGAYPYGWVLENVRV